MSEEISAQDSAVEETPTQEEAITEEASTNVQPSTTEDSSAENEIEATPEQQEELKEAIEEAMPELSEAQVAKLVANYKFKVKVDGEEREVDYETMMRDYQLASASQKRFQEASSKEKQAHELFEKLKTNPKAALSDPELGIDVIEFAEKLLVEHIEQQQMTPEQRRIAELEAQNKAFLQEKQAKEEAAKQEAHDAEMQAFVQEFKDSSVEALESMGLPTDETFVMRLKEKTVQALNSGMGVGPKMGADVNITYKQLASMVKDEYKQEIQYMLKSSKGDLLSELLGEDGLKTVRSIDISKIKSPKGSVERPAAKEESDDIDTSNMTMDEYFDYLKKKHK